MNHIILVGFKNVGKTSVAKLLAEELSLPFSDSDATVRELYLAREKNNLSCREIMRKHGQEYFRNLEHEALKNVLSAVPPQVIAVGGGAPLEERNELLLKGHTIIHVTASKGVVFERIMVNGWPAFFPREVDPYVSFQKIWNERMPRYESLAGITVENNRPLADVVKNLAAELLAVKSAN